MGFEAFRSVWVIADFEYDDRGSECIAVSGQTRLTSLLLLEALLPSALPPLLLHERSRISGAQNVLVTDKLMWRLRAQ